MCVRCIRAALCMLGQFNWPFAASLFCYVLVFLCYCVLMFLCSDEVLKDIVGSDNENNNLTNRTLYSYEALKNIIIRVYRLDNENNDLTN